MRFSGRISGMRARHNGSIRKVNFRAPTEWCFNWSKHGRFENTGILLTNSYQMYTKYLRRTNYETLIELRELCTRPWRVRPSYGQFKFVRTNLYTRYSENYAEMPSDQTQFNIYHRCMVFLGGAEFRRPDCKECIASRSNRLALITMFVNELNTVVYFICIPVLLRIIIKKKYLSKEDFRPENGRWE